jgi:superfamily II DNA or RNA helicase
MAKIKIIVNNQKSRLLADLKTIMQVRKVFAIKHPNYFWAASWRQHKWDGYIRYITEQGGNFKTGLLPQLCQHLDDLGKEYELVENREIFKDLHKPKEMGGLKFRDYQEESRASLVDNMFKGIRFQRGILKDATNAGKSLIGGGIIASFSKKRVAVILTNSKTLFEQVYPDMIKLFGKEDVGRMNSDHSEWKRINICMVQTFGIRMQKDPSYKNKLAKVDIVIADEADELIGRKDCQRILENTYNATIRVALTATGGMHKDPLRNQDLLAYFGPIVHITKNKELVEKGVSTPPDIRITTGSVKSLKHSYKEQYEMGIIKNKDRHRKIWARVARHIGRGRLPVLILFREHDHAHRILAEMPEELESQFTYTIVHGETPGREKIFEKFNKGRIDILLASMIIKRGKNLPGIRVLVNAAGGDSEVTVVQILGRALRKAKGKKKVWIEDFWDLGRNLRRHSYHRVRYYKNQEFPVKELYKK